MAKFFIHRPVFAIVISLIILIAGGVSIFNLPIAQYPQIAPPNVEVEINYQGANAETVEQSIASVVEAEVNGAERMIYMSSKSSSDGRYVLTCTFEVGTNLDLANVDINNRVSKAQAKLPPEAVAAGISIKKKSPDMLLAISVYAEKGAYDDVFLSNYASINLIDAIARTKGVGSTMLIGQRDYSMRFWVRPDRLSRLGLTGNDLSSVIKEQNVVAPAGQVGQPPAKAGTEFQYSINVKGRLGDGRRVREHGDPDAARRIHPSNEGCFANRAFGKDVHQLWPQGRGPRRYHHCLPVAGRERHRYSEECGEPAG